MDVLIEGNRLISFKQQSTLFLYFALFQLSFIKKVRVLTI